MVIMRDIWIPWQVMNELMNEYNENLIQHHDMKAYWGVES